MSAISEPQNVAELPMHIAALPRVPRPVYLYCMAAVLGVVTLLPSLMLLWRLWMADPLKSVGIFIPPVCFVLILREWRRIGWSANGTWWGLALILVNAALGWIQVHSILLLVFSRRWTTVLPPISLPLVLYGAGAVLLLGGTRLFRAAVFPICALWLANPVPRAFSLLVDLPLQTLSAHVARSFAMHLGQPLTPDHLRLMFTPEFGMFIAPGCNGIRGSVTMALIALIASYVYRFRWDNTAAIVAGSVLLGYLFNLLRLCALVVYYIIALRFPWMQGKAEMADYMIGGTLFLCATFLMVTVIHHMRETTAEVTYELDDVTAPVKFGYARPAALIFAACVAGIAFASAANPPAALTRTAEQRFPERVGGYKLVRTWEETSDTGVELYQWAEYAPAAGNSVAVGISRALSWHDPLICHTVRGEHPVWQGPMQVTTASQPVSFNSAMYADGISDVLEASTQCSVGGCNEFATTRTHFGLIYTPVARSSLLGAGRSLPVIVRAELPNSGGMHETTRAELLAGIRSFAASADLAELTRP